MISVVIAVKPTTAPIGGSGAYETGLLCATAATLGDRLAGAGA